MVLAFVRNELNHSRFGFVVSKRLGNAVQRNKVKRRIREATRRRIPSIKSGFDLVIIARRPITQATYKEIEQTLEHLLIKADLFTGQPAHSQVPIHTRP
jgi:ribonuclease P protein component